MHFFFASGRLLASTCNLQSSQNSCKRLDGVGMEKTDTHAPFFTYNPLKCMIFQSWASNKCWAIQTFQVVNVSLFKKNKQVSLLIRKPWDKIGGKVSYLEDELFVSKAKINIAIFWVLNLCTKIITTSVLLFGWSHLQIIFYYIILLHYRNSHGEKHLYTFTI